MSHKQLVDFLPSPSLTHLKRLTTKDGLVQHADHEVPDPTHGYSIDDNARALLVCAWHHQIFPDIEIRPLAKIYLKYITRVGVECGKFHNFLDYLGDIPGQSESEDAFGRTAWALAEARESFGADELGVEAKRLLDNIISSEREVSALRGQAYLLLCYIAQKNTESTTQLADKLLNSLKANQATNWLWFENCLYYANAIFPLALARAFLLTKNIDYLAMAEKTYLWLDQTCRERNMPAPIGQNGWYCRNQKKALFDQQPLETADMVMAALSLYEATKQTKYLNIALDWMGWYFGNNLHHLEIWNSKTRGVFDALTNSGVNENQGAESIVTYLMAHLSLSKIANEAN